MKAFVSGLAILAASISLYATTAAAADGACAPHVIESETLFPKRSQLRGHEGTVYIDVVVDANGRAQKADLQRSSGYRLLDRSATQSVLNNWVFDISTCERKDLPIIHSVAVEYRNHVY
ncbi:MAG: energy transducer TonB [Steroidobacteraceae bacterium]